MLPKDGSPLKIAGHPGRAQPAAAPGTVDGLAHQHLGGHERGGRQPPRRRPGPLRLGRRLGHPGRPGRGRPGAAAGPGRRRRGDGRRHPPRRGVVPGAGAAGRCRRRPRPRRRLPDHHRHPERPGAWRCGASWTPSPVPAPGRPRSWCPPTASSPPSSTTTHGCARAPEPLATDRSSSRPTSGPTRRSRPPRPWPGTACTPTSPPPSRRSARRRSTSAAARLAATRSPSGWSGGGRVAAVALAAVRYAVEYGSASGCWPGRERAGAAPGRARAVEVAVVLALSSGLAALSLLALPPSPAPPPRAGRRHPRGRAGGPGVGASPRRAGSRWRPWPRWPDGA